MNILEEIKKADKSSKEFILSIAAAVKKDKNIIKQLVETLDKCDAIELATCISILEHITKNEPELVLPHIQCITRFINNPTPRVKWETSCLIGNMAAKFPDNVFCAAHQLLLNTNDDETVVKWSAAFALTEMAKNSPKARKILVPKFHAIMNRETNSGVKNVYVKTLRYLERRKK